MGKVSEFKAAVAAGRKLRDLVFKLSLADANEIASSESPLKKLAHLVLRGAAKIHAVVDAAAESVERKREPSRNRHRRCCALPSARPDVI